MSEQAKLTAPSPEEMLALEEAEAAQAAPSFAEDISEKILALVKPETKEGLLKAKLDTVFQPIHFDVITGEKLGGTVAVNIISKSDPKLSVEEAHKQFAELLDQTHSLYPLQGNVLIATQFNVSEGPGVIVSYVHLRYQDYDNFMTKLHEAAVELAKNQVDELKPEVKP